MMDRRGGAESVNFRFPLWICPPCHYGDSGDRFRCPLEPIGLKCLNVATTLRTRTPLPMIPRACASGPSLLPPLHSRIGLKQLAGQHMANGARPALGDRQDVTGGDFSRPNSWRSRLSAPGKRAACLRRVTSRHRRVLTGRGDGYGIRYDTPPRGLIVRVQAPMQLEPFEPAVHNFLTTQQCCRCPRRSRPSARRFRALRDLSEASRFGPRACGVLTGAGVGGTPPPPEAVVRPQRSEQ